MRRLIFNIAILSIAGISAYGQDRYPAVAGSFYSSSEVALKKQLEQFFSGVEDRAPEEGVAAVIVPHAGYVFSGPVAASAFAKIDPEKSYRRVFLIGTSHHMLLNGASVYSKGDYITPLGRVEVDKELAGKLIRENRLISYEAGAHSREHSLEVQLPFLQYHLKKPFKIVPVVIGTRSARICSELAGILRPYFNPENLFVISSDFSHYPSYEDANSNDRATGEAVLSNSPERFMETRAASAGKNIPGLSTSCCGWSSVLTLLDLTSEDRSIRVRHMKYMNSGDSPYGDKERVVGYHAFVFSRESDRDEFVLTPADKDALLKIARQSIRAGLENRETPRVPEDLLSDRLLTCCGAFVTLNKDGRLRGCIGRFMPEEPLYQVVQQMASAAAFRDTRFYPVAEGEMDDIHIEISVLTPLKRIYSAEEFSLGKQGIYIVKGNRSGTFLPQVAVSTGWNREEFLGHCSRDKAGIGWDGWKDAELYTYEALVFEESQH